MFCSQSPSPSSRGECYCPVVSEAGSYLRLIDSCITQLKAQGPSRTCNESNEERRRSTALPWCEGGDEDGRVLGFRLED